MKSILMAALMAIAMSSSALTQNRSSEAARASATEQEEVLRTEQEQRAAYLRRDVEATKRLVADEFILTIPEGIGTKATLITFLKETPADPTLTLAAEDTEVRVNGDTAIVVGRRVERRRRPDNNQEGTAYARYTRTYVKRQGRWQLLSEHLQTIPSKRTASKVDPKVYDDYVGRYDSPIFAFSVVREGDRLIAVPDEKERPRAELLPESEAEFFLQGRDAQVIFVRDRKGQVIHALLRINGADIRARRIG